ncbi:MAG: hypothetical protein H6684_12210 [Deltaproteobacteria bacterium]|nr:hypothetical protein [Deltaproteobacteria bacterium]
MLALLVLASFVANVWGNDLGAPDYEGYLPFSTQLATFLNTDGMEGPREYSAVGFLHYRPAAALIARFGVPSQSPSDADNPNRYWHTNARLFPAIRWTNAVLGALAVGLMGLLLRRHIPPGVVLIALAFIAVDATYVFWNHTESIIPLTLIWSLLAATFFCRYLFTERMADIALLAACGGVAAAVKENHLGLAPALVAIAVPARAGLSMTWRTSRWRRRWWACVGVGAAAFIVTIAGTLSIDRPFNRSHIDHYLHAENINPKYQSELAMQNRRLGPGEIAVGVATNLAAGLDQIRDNLGGLPALIILGVFVASIRRRWFRDPAAPRRADPSLKFAGAFAAAAGAYLLTYVSWFPFFWRRIERYDLVLPTLLLLPVLAVGVRWLALESPRRWRLAGRVLAALVVLSMAARTAALIVAFETDPRERLNAFVRTLAPDDAPVSVGYLEGREIPVPPDIDDTRVMHGFAADLNDADTDYIAMDEATRDAYEAALAKRPLSRRFAEDKAFTYPAFVRRYSFDLGPEATYLYSRVVGSSP